MPFRPRRFLPFTKDDERVYLVVRKHWMVLILRVLVWVVFVGLLMFVDGMIKTNLPDLSIGRPGLIIAIIRSILLLLSLLGLFMVWALYYLNVQVITNRRVIDIDQKSLLNHETSELTLENIEDVTAQIEGPIANLFDYGNVIIQTAGEKERFIFEDVPHPHDTARFVLELYERVVAHTVPPAND